MKKGLLLSIVASTVLFAGGDIAPVEPVAEAPAAACNDFYGHAAVGIIYGTSTENNVTSTKVTYGAAAVLGVTKEIFSGVTFNAEVQGASLETYKKVGDDNGTRAPGFVEQGGLTQFNLGYSWCNTAIKVGRFSVPENLSPLSYTDTNYFGLKDKAYEGVLVANTDIPDTTVWGAYLYNLVQFGNSAGERSRLGIVAGGLVNKSFADTTITLTGYYDVNASSADTLSELKFAVAGSIDKKWCDTDLSLGGAYAAYDHNTTGVGKGSDYIIGAYIKQNFDASYIKVGATYGARNASFNYHKYTGLTNHKSGDANNTWAIGAEAGTDWCGYKLKAFGNYRQDKTYQIGAAVSKKVSGINLALDYRLNHNGVSEVNSHRVRAKAVYKF
jgi:hypothetical protein